MTRKLSERQFHKALTEAGNDSRFIKEINQFIKITSGVYKLKDYGLK